jgi:SAM-dependent methyltransferase
MKQKIRSDAPYFKLPIERINALPKNKIYKLLDIGAGQKYLKSFLPKNVKYYSLDCDGDHNYIIDLDKSKIPVGPGTYDIIVCLETLEHTLYPKRVLAEILRVAKKDAIFFLSMPNEYNFYCRLNFLLGRKTFTQEPFEITEKHLHIHYPRVKDVLELFSKYIKILKVDYNWYSRTGSHNNNLRGRLSLFADKVLGSLIVLSPSLFARNVIVYGIKKQ